MKKIYIIGSMVFDSPTTQVEKFRFALLPNNSAKEIKTEKTNKIHFWKWFDTIEQARECIKGINEQFVLDGGTRTKLYILPIVVDTDSYELVTEENMQYYDKNSEWVKNFKEEMQSLYY